MKKKNTKPVLPPRELAVDDGLQKINFKSPIEFEIDIVVYFPIQRMKLQNRLGGVRTRPRVLYY